VPIRYYIFNKSNNKESLIKKKKIHFEFLQSKIRTCFIYCFTALSKNIKRSNFCSVTAKKNKMGHKFRTGDHVKWNSEAGTVSGKIIRVHEKNFDYKGYTHHASKEEPQYEIKSDKTDHIAAHKGPALSLVTK
jgi:hypothetical protein